MDNLGLPYSSINTAYSNNGVIGTMDGDILVSLKDGHRPTGQLTSMLRKQLSAEFPGTTIFFLPADMVTQILNFGLPAPIDVQVVGNNLEANRQFTDQLLAQLRGVPGLVDMRIQQPFDEPKLSVSADRTKVARSRIHAKGCRFEPAGVSKRQLSDDSDVLPQPDQRHQLQRSDAGSAI